MYVLVLFYNSKGRGRLPAPPPPAGADPTAVLLRPCSRCILRPCSRCIPRPNPETIVVAVLSHVSPRQPPFVVGCSCGEDGHRQGMSAVQKKHTTIQRPYPTPTATLIGRDLCWPRAPAVTSSGHAELPCPCSRGRAPTAVLPQPYLPRLLPAFTAVSSRSRPTSADGSWQYHG